MPGIKLKNIFKNDVVKICAVVIVSLAAFIIFGGIVLVCIKFFELGYVPAPSPPVKISKPGSAESNLMLKLLNGSKQDQQTVNIYFGNEIKNPNVVDCSLVYPVDRKLTVNSSSEETALTEMLKGPTEAEKAAGYFTAINNGVKINSLSVNNGIARVDFDKKIEEAVGGSCRVSLIRSEITQTLLQFTNVKSVVISVEGNIDEALQP
jgi:Spore germination protein